MIKSALSAVIALLGLCLPLAAQDANFMPNELSIASPQDSSATINLYRADILNSVESSALVHALPIMALLDGVRVPVSNELARMGMRPLGLFPIALLDAVPAHRPSRSTVNETANDNEPSVSAADFRSDPFWSSGEVGFRYGKSIGKHGGDDYAGYVIGSVGNDKVTFTAGASYEESSFRFHR